MYRLKTLIREDSRGIIIRSRFKQNAEEERASIYHAARLLKNKKHEISKLRVGSDIVSEDEVIENEVLK